MKLRPRHLAYLVTVIYYALLWYNKDPYLILKSTALTMFLAILIANQEWGALK